MNILKPHRFTAVGNFTHITTTSTTTTTSTEEATTVDSIGGESNKDLKIMIGFKQPLTKRLLNYDIMADGLLKMIPLNADQKDKMAPVFDLNFNDVTSTNLKSTIGLIADTSGYTLSSDLLKYKDVQLTLEAVCVAFYIWAHFAGFFAPIGADFPPSGSCRRETFILKVLFVAS